MSPDPRSLPVFLLLLALPFLWACGEPSAEEKLRRATEALVAAEKAADAARVEFEATESKLNEAQLARDAAAERLREAEGRLAEAKAEVALHATDDLLFRSVQQLLLDDSELRDVAIRAEVHDGVVVLSGSAPNAELREKAVQLASSVPGVVDVQSRITLETPPPVAAPAPAGEEKKSEDDAPADDAKDAPADDAKAADRAT